MSREKQTSRWLQFTTVLFFQAEPYREVRIYLHYTYIKRLGSELNRSDTGWLNEYSCSNIWE